MYIWDIFMQRYKLLGGRDLQDGQNEPIARPEDAAAAAAAAEGARRKIAHNDDPPSH
jgi:hypothetical protein